MSYTLRDYQENAVQIAVEYMRKNSVAVLLELATGAGKSLICAEVSKIMVELSKKKVLCLCPTSELVQQNYEKYLLTGNKASIFSASISKSLVNDVVFATEGSFKSVAKSQGQFFSTVIIDECHRISPTIKKIISEMKESNPQLRVLGMSATPYRLGEGYVYRTDEKGMEVEASKPYFEKKLVTVGAEYLISLGFLTKPVIGEIHSVGYDTSNIKIKSNGMFDQKTVDEAFVGRGDKTANIVADVVNQANIRQSKGVMFFAATVDHAKEIMESLPNYNSGLITGETKSAERKRIINAFKKQEIRYLVNVSVLTTGFDAPHVDLIAVLRATESASLYQQIIGRALRLFDGKEEALILDYAENIERFFPDGNLFNPEIEARGDKPKQKGDFTCPLCSNVNKFTLRPNPDEMDIDANGYFLTISGERYKFESGAFYPAHFGRRCQYTEALGLNNFSRCTFFWDFKECEECGAENDITARKCVSCKALLIDPNNKLVGVPLAYKNDLTQIQSEKILRFSRKDKTSKTGNPMIQAYFKTNYREFVAFFSSKVNRRFYEMMQDSAFKPVTVSFKKNSQDFFTVVDFNRKEDFVNENT